MASLYRTRCPGCSLMSFTGGLHLLHLLLFPSLSRSLALETVLDSPALPMSCRGVIPVAGCGVRLKSSRALETAFSISLGVWLDIFMAFPISFMAHSAGFERGWYGGENVWVILEVFMKWPNSAEWNIGALSVLTALGYPSSSKMARSAPIVSPADGLGMITAAGYLELLHLATTTCLPPGMGPNRSTATVCHGCGGTS